MKLSRAELNIRFNIMDRLLSDFGNNKLTHDQFWAKMREHDLTDMHITWFLDEMKAREAARRAKV